MTQLPTTCPPAKLLADFGLGKLDVPSAETVEAHLETCDDCQRIVAELPGDSFVNRLRIAHGQSVNAAESVSEAQSDTPSIDAPRASAAANAEVPPELANHPDYELVKELGRGGMGVVYLARNRMMDRLEVLKVVNKSLLDKPGALERFQQEIRAAARLLHPNIVAAHAVFRLGDLLVFAMEYVDGQDLSKTVKRRGSLPAVNATFYAHQVALGLQHALEKGMVHRDIKPGNLMLAVVNKKHVVKILDFGLAKATSEKVDDGGLTKSGMMLGTPDYIAPEQTLDAQAADIRADIYSLGCTLYFLLAGRAPFKGSSLYETLRMHHAVEADPLNTVRADVPAELAAVVAKMMAKRPEDRYQAPQEVSQALKPFFRAGSQLPVAKGEQSQHLDVVAAMDNLDVSLAMQNQALRALSIPESVTAFQPDAPSPLISRLQRSPMSTKPAGAKGPPRKNAKLLIAAGGAGFFALLLGVIVIIRNHKGDEVARFEAPTGASVEVMPVGSQSGVENENFQDDSDGVAAEMLSEAEEFHAPVNSVSSSASSQVIAQSAELFRQLANTKPLFVDEFDDPKSGFPVIPRKQTKDGIFEEGYRNGRWFVAHSRKSGIRHNSPGNLPTGLSHFVYEVSARLIDGDGWGLFCRNAGTKQALRVSLHKDLVLNIGIGQNGGDRIVGKHVAAIRPMKEINTITLVVANARLWAFVNEMGGEVPIVFPDGLFPLNLSLSASGGQELLAEFERVAVWGPDAIPSALLTPVVATDAKGVSTEAATISGNSANAPAAAKPFISESGSNFRDVLTIAGAMRLVGRNCVVEMTVASTGQDVKTSRAFLNSEADRTSSQNFAVVLESDAVRKYSGAIESLNGCRVRVTGTVTVHQGRPQIVITAPTSIETIKLKPGEFALPKVIAPLPDPKTKEPPAQRVIGSGNAPNAPSNDGFVSLFNGRDLAGWNVDDGNVDEWKIENGAIVAQGDGTKSRNHLLTIRDYSDFRLRLEFALDANASSGVVIRANVKTPVSKTGSRYDIPIFKIAQNGTKEQTGTTHWITNRHSDLPAKVAKMKAPGEWNTLELEVVGRHLHATVNGDTVVETDVASGLTIPDGSLAGLARTHGRVGVQKHTGTVRFRKIEIKELPSAELAVDTTPKATTPKTSQAPSSVRAKLAVDPTKIFPEIAGPAPLDAQGIVKALAAPIKQTWKDSTLAEVARDLRQAYRMNVLLDEAYLEEAGVNSKRLKLSWTDNRTSLELALKTMLEPRKLIFTVYRDSLWITSNKQECSLLELAAYTTANTVTPATAKEFISSIEKVDPLLWSTVGGCGVCRLGKGVLLVDQRSETQREIERRFSAHIRRIKPQAIVFPQSEKIRTALATPVSWQLTGEPLDEIVQAIDKHLGVTMLLKTNSLSDAAINPSAPCQLEVNRQPLAHALDALLRGHKLAWLLDGDLIVVTTPKEAESTCTAIEYDATLMNAMFGDAKAVLACIQAVVQPRTWSEVGGRGTVQFLPERKTLSIDQNYSAHADLHYLFALLQSASGKPTKPAVTKATP